MSELPKMLSKREIELEELEEAKYVQSLRDENQKLQEQLNTAKKALTEIEDITVYPVDKYDDSCGYDWESAIEKAEKTARQALAAIEKGENNEI